VAHIKLDSVCTIGVESDILFPLYQQRDIAHAFLANGIRSRLLELASDQGHDSFLVDYNRFKPAVARYFEEVLASE
jgi:homoserine acetyltransferase